MPAHLVRCSQVTLLRPLGPQAWLARLPNGHELAVVVPRALSGVELAEGMIVSVDISPADFTQARLVGPAAAE